MNYKEQKQAKRKAVIAAIQKYVLAIENDDFMEMEIAEIELRKSLNIVIRLEGEIELFKDAKVILRKLEDERNTKNNGEQK